ncbi:Uncharacterized protein DBV15_12949 [Temnothorax longispinosus]|uniref:Uncharacterized protein n=1 Tax=Temnothorax longispinosus TaxID=300112 RepID=A0A4S2K9P5_9HYME|nr:Uncharacterized protein DBV15_12949 [Temnothorax longispinosus]
MEDAASAAAAPAPATAVQDACFGAGSVAGAVIGTFLTTILLLAVAALLYRQWRRHKSESLSTSQPVDPPTQWRHFSTSFIAFDVYRGREFELS